jgi:TRAP-type mannitol/chloroaromatic compound transport system substrate-binding protein
VYARFNVVQLPCGNTGAQMGGWFRKEITQVSDFQGLRIRTPGFLGMVYSKLGAVPQQIAGGDIYPALEKGTLDAVEWVGPYDDEKLGFGKIAKFYYGPGVMELGASLAFIVNKSAWDALPQPFKDALAAACAEAGMDMLAKYDANNIAALKRLVASGVSLRQWPQPVMRAMQQATNAVLDENAASNPTFKRVYEQWRPFRNDQQLWYSVNDGAAEQFLYANRERS